MHIIDFIANSCVHNRMSGIARVEIIHVQKGDMLQFLKPILGRIAYLAMTHIEPAVTLTNEKLIEKIDELLFTPAPIRFIPGPAWNDLDTSSIQAILHQPKRISV